MPTEHQVVQKTSYIPEDEMWKIRWFLIRLNAVALLLSIPASVIIAILTKNPLPGLIPAPLIAPLILIIRWAFSKEDEKPKPPVLSKVKRIVLKQAVQPDILTPSG